jgi:competence protein ComEC
MKWKISVLVGYYAVLLFHSALFASSSEFRLSVLDVSQGDSVQLVTPHGKVVLIDGGGNWEAVSLLQRGWPLQTCMLDRIILTHPHSDHLVGFERILTSCKIRVATFNDVSYTSKAYVRFQDLLKINNVKIDNEHEDFMLDDVSFKFLWPLTSSQNKNFRFSNINDSSLVLFVDYKGFEALLLGDLGTVHQKDLKIDDILPYIDGRLDLLKISHHGAASGYNSDLVTKLKPVNCVISVGKKNAFGHPHSIVIDDLTKHGCRIFRTDMDGTIEFGI